MADRAGANGFRVTNATRGAVLAERSARAGNMVTRGLGLMGRSGLPEGGGLLIPGCTSVTSLFMRFAIDVLFLDKEGNVVHLIEAMRPWRNSRMVRASRLVVELPAGTIERSGTALGDTIEIAPA